LKMPRTITMIFVFMMLLTTLRATRNITAADSGTILTVEPQANFAQMGRNFTVTVRLSNVKDLYGGQFTIRWNTTALQLVKTDLRIGVEDFPDGVLHKPVYTTSGGYENSSIYFLSAGSPSPPSFNGSGNIAKITFNVTHVGNSQLALTDTMLVSNVPTENKTSLKTIDHTVINGAYYPITISATPKASEGITVNGSVALAQANIPVTILYKSDNETVWHTAGTVNTTAEGTYTYTWSASAAQKYDLKSTATLQGTTVSSTTVSVSAGSGEAFPWIYVGLAAAVAAIAVTAVLLIYFKKIRKRS